jgi:excisionase family DNA binding protein
VRADRAPIELEPLALSPQAAAHYLGISKRSLSRLIVDGKIIARKLGSRTLIDVAALKAYYAGLPKKYDCAATTIVRRSSVLLR